MLRPRSFPFILAIIILAAILATVSAQAQTLTVLYSFKGGTDGALPLAGLVLDAEGNLYGTTYQGGTSSMGTVFKVDITGKETVLYSFTGTGGDGANPYGGLLRDAQGNLYGTTVNGGDPNPKGTLFKVDTTGKETVLHSFTDAPDGALPKAGLVQDTQGNLYGTTGIGGTHGDGTVFKVDTMGKETVLYSFGSAGGDGAIPLAGLVQDTQGNLYGTTFTGGSKGDGTVFKVDMTGKETVLHSFTDSPDGSEPYYAGVVRDAQGNLYGTTVYGGGMPPLGTVFKVDATGKETVLYSFTGGTKGDGAYSEAGLVQDTHGNLYGTTISGGAYSNGTVFKLDTTGKETVLYSFTGTKGDGSAPQAGLVQDMQGNLYGTTTTGGAYGHGTVFKLAPTAVQFSKVTPCRVVDTRNANGTFGGPAIEGGTFRSFPIPQSTCDIPSTAVAYSLNVTAVPHGGLGYLTIWPTGENQPYVSTLNSYDGRVKANAAIVPAGDQGAVSVYVSNTSDVALDIDGYFAPGGNSTLQFYPLAPCRVADTRGATGDLGAPYLKGGVPRDFPVLEASSCHIPNTAQAYSLNFTAIPRGPLGYLSVWPTGESQPYVSTLNSYGGQVVANAAIVPAGTAGKVSTYASNDTDLVIDINGYFAAAGRGGLALYPVEPCRVLDTRNVGNGQPFSGTLVLDVLGSMCAPPSTAEAYVFNATAVPSGVLGFLALWPDGGSLPVVSTLNSWDGAVSSNMAIVPAGTGGKIDAYASNLTQLILDISSYFAP